MQGFNMGRYIPPDDGTGAGSSSSSKPRTSRARGGAQVVRFEMPFAVWCGHCARPTLIGQGVRFNAEKRRAGAYHSTPVWSFVLRHGACGGAIEVRTDPANAEYVVVSGARRRDYGGGRSDSDGESLVKSAGGLVAIATPRERAEQRETAFGRLEKTIADREQLEGARQRIAELQDAGERQWEDPYALNQRLRRAFREGRHARERDAAKADEVKERMGLGIELLPETAEDAKRAGLVDFGSVEEGQDVGVDKALAKPLFQTPSGSKEKKNGGSARKEGPKRLKSEIAASRMRENLVSEIVSNTRAAKDPFLDFGNRHTTPKGPARLAGLKRKRVLEEAPDPPPSAPERETPRGVAGTTPLVNYNSDSD